MLKQRLLTAIVLATAMITMIATLPPAGFGLLLLVIALAGAWEWGGLLKLSSQLKAAYCLLVTLVIALLWWLRFTPPLLWGLLAASAGFWCWVSIWLWRFQRRDADGQQKKVPAVLLGIVGLILLTIPWFALVALRSDPAFGIGHVLFFLALIWIADSGAYFAGRRFGKRKLAPRISPGKTQEGVIGALAISLPVALVGIAMLAPKLPPWPLFVALCGLTVVFSVVGDLFESMIKRQHGVKDSGSLLPGHGGVLDRIDSITAAAPLFLLGLLVLTKLDF